MVKRACLNEGVDAGWTGGKRAHTQGAGNRARESGGHPLCAASGEPKLPETMASKKYLRKLVVENPGLELWLTTVTSTHPRDAAAEGESNQVVGWTCDCMMCGSIKRSSARDCARCARMRLLVRHPDRDRPPDVRLGNGHGGEHALLQFVDNGAQGKQGADVHLLADLLHRRDRVDLDGDIQLDPLAPRQVSRGRSRIPFGTLGNANGTCASWANGTEKSAIKVLATGSADQVSAQAAKMILRQQAPSCRSG